MKILLLMSLIVLQTPFVLADTQGQIEINIANAMNKSHSIMTSETEASSCSLKECLNLSAKTNANNEGKQGSRFIDQKTVRLLSGVEEPDGKTQDTQQ